MLDCRFIHHRLLCGEGGIEIMEAQAFFDKFAPYAVKAYKEEGILASLTLAQAWLESGHGESQLSKEYNNFFGIKGRGSKGTVTLPTHEWNGTKMVTVNAGFAHFASPLESFEAHIRLFKDGVSWDRNKYKNLFGVKDYKVACRLVQKDGYATDPDYTQKLIGVIESYGLAKYDKDTEQKKSDEQLTATWAQESRKQCMDANISDGSRPLDKITRQEVWCMIARTMDWVNGTIEERIQKAVEAKIEELFPKNTDQQPTESAGE